MIDDDASTARGRHKGGCVMMTLKRGLAGGRTGPVLRGRKTLRGFDRPRTAGSGDAGAADPELYRAGAAAHFARRGWGLAHVSELSNVGLLVVRHIGEDRASSPVVRGDI